MKVALAWFLSFWLVSCQGGTSSSQEATIPLTAASPPIDPSSTTISFGYAPSTPSTIASPSSIKAGIVSVNMSTAQVPVRLTYALASVKQKALNALSTKYRRLQYVSSSNTLLNITVTLIGGSPTTYGPIACTATACTASFSANPGFNTIALVLTDDSGNVLSRFNVQKIIQPSGLNTINFTANPVVHSVSLQLASINTLIGTPVNDVLIVNAQDSDGNTIVGNAPYIDSNGDPVTLSLHVTNNQAGGTGTVTIQGPSIITGPNQATIYAHYDGNTLASATISVTTSSGTVAILTNATLKILSTITMLHKNNGAYLGHAYVSTASFLNANVATMASNMQYKYATNRLFVICGNINSSGNLTNGSSAVPQITAFLNSIAAWESSNPGYHFQVFAYLSGSLTAGSSFIDVSNSSVRSNIAAEADRFTDASVSGSYVAGVNRTFDGVFIDFEPSGGTSAAANTQFNNLTLLMDGIQASIGSQKLVAFAAPQYSTSTSSAYYWSPDFYYGMAGHVGLLLAMEYDTQIIGGPAYQAWIQAQTISILQAVSGEYWNDSSHLPPTNNVKVLFSVPAYSDNPPNHVAAAENTLYAMPGISTGLTSLDPTALSYFAAAIVYLTTNGSGTDGYASYSNDWTNFAANW
jgi:hypothetical protein